MRVLQSWGAGVFLSLSLSLPTAAVSGCGDGSSDDRKEEGEGTGGSSADGTGGDSMDREAPVSCSILEQVVGTYTVGAHPTGNEHRGESTAQHQRGSVVVSEDYAIDFDEGIAFAADEIEVCYDRTDQEFDRRIQVSFGADDSAEVLNIYLSDDLEVEEIQFRHQDESINVRVSVE